MGRSTITLDDLTANNLGTFKKINQAALPASYPESWYKDSLNADQITKLAFYSELPVGAIKAKLVNSSHKVPSFEAATAPPPNNIVPNTVYVESVAVLEAYRGQGVATKLFDWLVGEAEQRFVHLIMLHVHVDNTAAIEWYKKRGFVQGEEVVANYYQQQGLANPDAVTLTLEV